MGRSREAKQVNTDLTRQQDEQRRLYETLVDKYSTMGNQAYDRSNNLYNEALTNYRDILGDIGTGPESEVFSNLAETGGYSPADRAELEGNIGDYKRFASSADISPEDRARFRGLGVYDEFAKTGGFDEAQTRDFRARGASTIPAFYDALKNHLSQQNAAQGGYSPGYEAGNRALARDQSREATKKQLETETLLQDMIRRNKLEGAGGASRTESDLQNLLSKRFLEGMGGATDTRFKLNENVAKNQLAGVGGLRDTNQDKLAVVNAMTNLRGQTPGEVASYNNSLNQAAIGGSSAANETLQTRAGFNKGGDLWGNIGKIAGGVGSALSAFGLGSGKTDEEKAADAAKKANASGQGPKVTGSEGDTRNPADYDDDDAGPFSTHNYTSAFDFRQPTGTVTTDERYNIPGATESYYPGGVDPYADQRRRYWNS